MALFEGIRTDPGQTIRLAVGEQVTRNFEFGPEGSNDMAVGEIFTSAEVPVVTPGSELAASSSTSGTKIVVDIDATSAVAGTIYKITVQGTTNADQQPIQAGLVRVGNP